MERSLKYIIKWKKPDAVGSECNHLWGEKIYIYTYKRVDR